MTPTGCGIIFLITHALLSLVIIPGIPDTLDFLACVAGDLGVDIMRVFFQSVERQYYRYNIYIKDLTVVISLFLTFCYMSLIRYLQMNPSN